METKEPLRLQEDQPSPPEIRSNAETGYRNQRPRTSKDKTQRRVTIQSETTIFILHEPGTFVVRRNDPYFTAGCGKNVRWVANIDIALCMLEVICCSVAVAYAFLILEEPWVPKPGTYSGRELLQAIITLGFMLILCYFGEMWVAHRLLSVTAYEGPQDRHDVLTRARWWRCSNFILVIFELFFGICGCVGDDSRTLASSGALVGVILRVLGICVLHQFIQELDTVTVTPDVAITERATGENARRISINSQGQIVNIQVPAGATQVL